MDAVWNWLTRLAKVAILAGCALLFVAALLVTAEVLVRKALPDFIDLVTWVASLVFINVSATAVILKLWIRDHLTFSGSDELSGYLFAIGTSWSMAHVLVTRGHVRIDALYGALSARVRAILDVVSLALLAVFVGALLERAFDVSFTNLIENNRSNTNLRIPLAWSQIPWLAGIALFMLTILVAILKSLISLFQGDFAAVNSIAGASTQDEEIEGELKGLGIETPHGART